MFPGMSFNAAVLVISAILTPFCLATDYKEAYLDQKIDHSNFQSSGDQTYKQRYLLYNASCSSVRDCAVNEKCIDNRCHVQCLRDRDCYSGKICEQNFCRLGCRADIECAFHEACINNQCINPCDSLTACGTNASCEVINHSIHCTCPSGLTGDPYTKCDRAIQRCDADDKCGLGRYCEDNICRLTCSSDNECLDNEKCIEKRCSVFCTSDKSCPTGFICEYGQCIAGCRRDAECPLTEACINNQCLNPCASPTACGTKAQCQPVNHRPLCSCLPEHTGDPRVECSRVECIIDSDCDAGRICQNYRCLVGCRSDQGCLNDEVCISRQCQKLCMFSNTCGTKAICAASTHRAQCSCPADHTGNPVVECRKIEGLCDTNADCLPGKICVNKRCEGDSSHSKRKRQFSEIPYLKGMMDDTLTLKLMKFQTESDARILTKIEHELNIMKIFQDIMNQMKANRVAKE